MSDSRPLALQAMSPPPDAMESDSDVATAHLVQADLVLSWGAAIRSCGTVSASGSRSWPSSPTTGMAGLVER